MERVGIEVPESDGRRFDGSVIHALWLLITYVSAMSRLRFIFALWVFSSSQWPFFYFRFFFLSFRNIDV